MKRFDYIDAVRGYAIMNVLIVHVGVATGLGPTLAWGARSAAGQAPTRIAPA
jgi:peptidoglycan/LPS O-acetylase OafA/YrhL